MAPGEINPQVRQQAIGNEEPITVRPADLLNPELSRLKSEIDSLARSPEDVLSYAMFPEVGREFLQQRADGTLTPEPLEAPAGEPPAAESPPTEFNVTLHGETYHIRIAGSGHKSEARRPFFVTVDGLPEEVGIEVLHALPGGNGEQTGAGPSPSRRPRASRPGQVATSMPATVVEVLVAEGEEVEAGSPLLVTEAMKMESEIQAPIAGTIRAVNVTKGDRVNPDEALIEIE
jgi:pyruvate carboxylase subunit B